MKFLRSQLLAPWVPPLPLAFGQICFGASWIALVIFSIQGMPSGLRLLGWLHLLTLGWVTTIALAMLTHVIPQFTDEHWRNEEFPRISQLVYMLGAAVTIVGFVSSSLALMRVGGVAVAVGVLMFCAAAAPSLIAAMKSKGRRATIGQALTTSVGFLLLTVLMGNLVANVIGPSHPDWLDRASAAHGMLGILGWLSVLIMGVSTRTLQPLTGVEGRRPAFHIIAASGVLVGTLLGVLAVSAQATSLALGSFILIFAAALLYAMEVIGVVLRAVVRHRIPQAFMFAGVVCFVAAAGLVLLTFADPTYLYPAIYLALIGWIGNALLAHMHHIAVRVLVTLHLGDEDETRPGSVLRPVLSTLTFIAYEGAVAVGAAGFFWQDHSLLVAAGIFGEIAFLLMVFHFVLVNANLRRRATRPPGVMLIRP
jgi:hypothetical protein